MRGFEVVRVVRTEKQTHRVGKTTQSADRAITRCRMGDARKRVTTEKQKKPHCVGEQPSLQKR